MNLVIVGAKITRDVTVELLHDMIKIQNGKGNFDFENRHANNSFIKSGPTPQYRSRYFFVFNLKTGAFSFCLQYLMKQLFLTQTNQQ
jgi:hypothetical protein